MLRLQTVPQPDASLGGYTYRKPIAITQPTQSTLSDFAVNVRLDADPDLMLHAEPDGSDLVFASGSDLLACEVVEYSGGSLNAWVRVPQLPTGTTTIYLYYGGPARAGVANQTWADPLHGVWHEEHSDATEPDSSRFTLDLSAGVNIPTSVPGISGKARSFGGDANQQMCVGDNGTLSFDMSSLSYSMWVYVPAGAVSSSIGEPLHKGGSAPPGAGFDFEFSLTWEAALADTGKGQTSVAITTPRADGWVQVAAVVDRTAGQLIGYADGIYQQSTSIASFGTLTDTSEALCIGGDSGGSYPFSGNVDEIRIYAGTLSADWIRFEYDNLHDPGSVIAAGPEEKRR